MEQTVEHSHPAIDMDILENLDLFLEQDFIPTLQLDHVASSQPIEMKESSPTVRLSHMTTPQPMTPEGNNLSTHIDPVDLSLGEHILDQFPTEGSCSATTKDPLVPDSTPSRIQVADLPCNTQAFDLDDLSTAENILDECMDTSFSLDCDASPGDNTFDLDSFISQNSPNSHTLHTESPSTPESRVLDTDSGIHTTGYDSGLDSGYDSNNTMSPAGFQFLPSTRCWTPDGTIAQNNMSHNATGSSGYYSSDDHEQLIATCMELQNRNRQSKEASKLVLDNKKALAEDESECCKVIEDEAECSKVTEDDFEWSVMKPAGGSKKKVRKPYETYVALIAKAMLASGKMRLTLGEIYDQVRAFFILIFLLKKWYMSNFHHKYSSFPIY